ncbi:Crp/Fnr family transcriptional regulator [Clostridium minihomine]|uniref:Crp/Fnr family transcriptional regulator n=1 Tax=Clostridium minihomine TaxID=2045012 RepID=UPI000C78FD02|nr:Crp/Fnr family transcriptional regulator [Clostridium minihomine]
MEKYLSVLKNVKLFQNFTEEETLTALACLGAYQKHYEKGETILALGDTLKAVGIVLNGVVYTNKEDLFGTRNLVTELQNGDIFGESLLCAGLSQSLHRILAATNCVVLYIQMDQIIHPSMPICCLRGRVIENLLQIIAQKNVYLDSKLDIISNKSLRKRIISFLYVQARKNGSREFEIPFSRTDLADYLNVDRSALSRELCRMRDEGLITFTKNSFSLHLERMDSRGERACGALVGKH